MLSGRSIKRMMGAAATGIGIVLMAAVCGCSGNRLMGGSPKFTLKVHSTRRLNTSGTAVAYPLNYACLQLTDPAPLAGMTVEQLWMNWASLPGAVFLSATTPVTIIPDSTRSELPVPIDPRAGAIVVVGAFGKSAGSCFYYVQPVPAKKKKSIKLDLTADSTCFVATSH